MCIKKGDVEYVARLARLTIPPDQIASFTRKLADIISYVDKLKEVDIAGTPPTSHPLPMKNVFREDTVTKSLDVKDVLANAPRQKENSFRVPRIIE